LILIKQEKKTDRQDADQRAIQTDTHTYIKKALITLLLRGTTPALQH